MVWLRFSFQNRSPALKSLNDSPMIAFLASFVLCDVAAYSGSVSVTGSLIFREGFDWKIGRSSSDNKKKRIKTFTHFLEINFNFLTFVLK